MQSITLFINEEVILPAFRRIMFLSAVKMRNGRMKEFTGNEPEMKSVEFNASAEASLDCWDVIWQSRISLPRRSAITKAGRLLLPDKSVKGKGMTTTSPFTKIPMPYPLQWLTNPLSKRFHLRNGFRFYRIFHCFRKHERLICEPMQITTVCRFSICFVSLMSPSLF